MKNFLVVLFFMVSAILSSYAELRTYPNTVAAGLPHNDDYTVKVREVGGEWHDLFEYRVQVDMDNVQNASMVQFDMDKPVEIMVKKNNGNIYDAQIRPKSGNIKYEQKGNCIFFRLETPRYLSVEFNGDRLHNLHLFANPLEKEVYTESSEGVLYFGPGTHRPGDLPNNQIRIPSNTTVYLAPGSIIKAKLLVDKAENVRIIGRGIIDHAIRGIEITDSRNVTVDGITVINPDHYSIFCAGSENVRIYNFKAFSCKGWSDGIDMMCCRDVVIDNVFLRNSDDCIAFYNHRWNWWGGSRDLTVRNAVLWADIAHPINMGGHGDDESDKGEILENVTVKNVDILECDEDDPLYQGCLNIDCGDKNIVRNVLFEDIRVESIQEGRLFCLKVLFNPKYNKAPGNGIYDIVFRNITYDGYGENPSLIKGYDKDHCVRGVTFDNVVVNGVRLDNTDEILTNEYIYDIKFK